MNQFRVLAHEDQAEFDRLLAAYRAEFAPHTGHECFLVDQLAQSRWRLARTRRFEALAFNQILTGETDETNPDARILAKLSEATKDIHTLLQRQARAAENSYYRAHRELIQAHSRKLRNEANEAKDWLKEQLLGTRKPRPEPPFDPTRATRDSWCPENPMASDAVAA